MRIRYEALGLVTLHDVVCCPGGLEVAGKTFHADLTEVARWRHRMLEAGMRGIVVYEGDAPRGFVEYMPAVVAPLPILADGAAVLMCYHWAGTRPEDPEHLAREREMIERVIDATRGRFIGLATQGWDIPTHFPIPLLEGPGFREIVRHGDVALMWLAHEKGAPEPALAPAAYAPRDLSREGLLAIDAAFSARCPYSLSSEGRLREAVDRHPLTERIQLRMHRIDTREEALALAVPPFDWSWAFFNAQPVDLFAYSGRQLEADLTQRIEALS